MRARGEWGRTRTPAVRTDPLFPRGDRFDATVNVTTEGHFRVLASPRDPEGFVLVALDGDGDGDGDGSDGGDESADEFEPVDVRGDGYDDPDLAERVAALRPGYVVDATLAWDDGTARFAAVDVRKRTLFEFVDGVTGMFEAATETWRNAAAAGEAMNSRVTRGTDGDPNGVLYVFASQSGARDLFAEFRDGTRPLEPLVRRVNETRGDGEREVFVLRPADEPFVAVYIALEKGGLLADTVRDTYDCPRPDEGGAD